MAMTFLARLVCLLALTLFLGLAGPASALPKLPDGPDHCATMATAPVADHACTKPGDHAGCDATCAQGSCALACLATAPALSPQPIQALTPLRAPWRLAFALPDRALIGRHAAPPQGPPRI